MKAIRRSAVVFCESLYGLGRSSMKLDAAVSLQLFMVITPLWLHPPCRSQQLKELDELQTIRPLPLNGPV